MDRPLVFTVSKFGRRSKWPLLGLVAIFIIRKVITRRSERAKIQSHFASRIEVVKTEREENIKWAREQTREVNEDEKKRIEGMNFVQLRDALQSGELKVETVIRVYYGLALRAHERTNCLTNVIKRALDEARAMDERAKDPTFKKPRLFGIPLSVKDSIEMEGHRCTWGLAKLADYYPNEDSYQVAKLRQEGMIPFCQTNLATSCLSYCCSNSLFGTTCNPLMSSRTSGGSSGGEGALIGSLGSMVGLGSDIAGSIRIPASYSGCCGFKPTSSRVSTLQLAEPLPWRPIAMLTEGPLAQDPHAIVEVMRALWSDNFISDKDASTVPVLFREDLFKEGTKFRIGYYTTDGYIDPLLGNQRVVREAVELLKAKGHELIPFSLDDIPSEIARGFFATITADGGAWIAGKLKDEPLPPLMEPLRGFVSTPLWIKKLLGWMIKLQGDNVTADSLLSSSKKASDIQKGIDRVVACRKDLLKKMSEEKIDLLICPATLTPAPPHSLPNTIPLTALMSTLLWNVMDWPAGVVTTGLWTEQDEAELVSYPEKGLVESGIKKGCKNSVGLPLSVQVVAPVFRDEMVLRVMVDLHDAMKSGETHGTI